jgi:DNA mismatch endonuclease (patch repair protein)
VLKDDDRQSSDGGREQQRLPEAMNEGRSRNMRANRRSNTKPEVALRSALHRLGYRYRKDHRLDLPAGVRVRPDIVFTRCKVAVFVDGCFWHVCPEHGREPTRNEWYWTPKLRRNVERDHLANEALAQAGWQVVRVWEHEDVQSAVGRVQAVIEHVFDTTDRE